jgi:hypothetical protein
MPRRIWGVLAETLGDPPQVAPSATPPFDAVGRAMATHELPIEGRDDLAGRGEAAGVRARAPAGLW